MAFLLKTKNRSKDREKHPSRLLLAILRGQLGKVVRTMLTKICGIECSIKKFKTHMWNCHLLS